MNWETRFKKELKEDIIQQPTFTFNGGVKLHPLAYCEVKKREGKNIKTHTHLIFPFFESRAIFLGVYSTVISSIVVSRGFLYLLRSKEEHTTLTDERAMQAPAAHGGNLIPNDGKKTPAAIGIAMTL